MSGIQVPKYLQMNTFFLACSFVTLTVRGKIWEIEHVILFLIKRRRSECTTAITYFYILLHTRSYLTTHTRYY